MKCKIGKIIGLVFVLIITSPVTIAVWTVNNKTLLGTFGEIIESNSSQSESKEKKE